MGGASKKLQEATAADDLAEKELDKEQKSIILVFLLSKNINFIDIWDLRAARFRIWESEKGSEMSLHSE